MAKHTNLTSLFTAIADAIRAKKGTTGTIVADNFPEEIAAIESGGSMITRYITLAEDNFTSFVISDVENEPNHVTLIKTYWGYSEGVYANRRAIIYVVYDKDKDPSGRYFINAAYTYMYDSSNTSTKSVLCYGSNNESGDYLTATYDASNKTFTFDLTQDSTEYKYEFGEGNWCCYLT